MENNELDVFKWLKDSEKRELERTEEISRNNEKNIAETETFLENSERHKNRFLEEMESLGVSVSSDEMKEAEDKAATDTEKLLREIEASSAVYDTPPVTYDDLIHKAHDLGYENTCVQDLLTEDEIARADRRFEAYEAEFNEKTRLNKVDAAFLVTAIAMQVVRQYVLTPIKERKGEKDGSESMKDKYGRKNYLSGDDYYATEDTIIHQPSVPFDAIAGSKDYDLGGEKDKGLNGDSHRYRSLGHDPILGYIFGTANIVTNTATWWNVKSNHIKYSKNAIGRSIPVISDEADTIKIFSALGERFHEENGKRVLVEAVLKEFRHLKSDMTKDGLPLPFLQLFSPDLAQELAEMGLDAVMLGDIGRQAMFAELIDFIISVVHGLICKEHEGLECKLYAVRTRKIILLSNAIASTSNIIAVGLASAIGIMSHEPEKVKKAIMYTDIGGILSTIAHLFSDVRFIFKVKEEFIQGRIDGELSEQLDDLNRKLESYN